MLRKADSLGDDNDDRGMIQIWETAMTGCHCGLHHSLNLWKGLVFDWGPWREPCAEAHQSTRVQWSRAFVQSKIQSFVEQPRQLQHANAGLIFEPVQWSVWAEGRKPKHLEGKDSPVCSSSRKKPGKCKDTNAKEIFHKWGKMMTAVFLYYIQMYILG